MTGEGTVKQENLQVNTRGVRVEFSLMETKDGTLFSIGATTTPANLSGKEQYAAPSFGLNVHDLSDENIIALRTAITKYLRLKGVEADKDCGAEFAVPRSEVKEGM